MLFVVVSAAAPRPPPVSVQDRSPRGSPVSSKIARSMSGLSSSSSRSRLLSSHGIRRVDSLLAGGIALHAAAPTYGDDAAVGDHDGGVDDSCTLGSGRGQDGRHRASAALLLAQGDAFGVRQGTDGDGTVAVLLSPLTACVDVLTEAGDGEERPVRRARRVQGSAARLSADASSTVQPVESLVAVVTAPPLPVKLRRLLSVSPRR